MFDAFFAFWGSIVGAFAQVLAWIHDLFATFVDPQTLAWGLAIIGLTLVIRVLLLPLAIKQTHSMRAMQELQPKIKEIQNKYDTDRSLLKKDPERYKDQRQQMNEEMMALYREEGVNPASGCLPLILQAPIFIALFDVLQSGDIAAIEGLQEATFLFLPELGTRTSAAGVAGWVMIALMALSMFLAQRQMMASRGGDSMGTQQKVMMFGMPVFLAFVAQGLPLGVLLYWVTTNVWQFGQQAVILHEVEDQDGEEDGDEGGDSAGKGSSGGKAGRTDSKPKSSTGSSRGSDDGRRSEGDGHSRAGSDGSKKTSRSSKPKGHTPSRRSS